MNAADVAAGSKPSEARVASTAETPVVAQGLRRTERAESEFTVIFQPRSFRLDGSAQTEVEVFARGVDRSASFEVRAFASSQDGAVTEGRRVAYYRAMVLRQRLVDAGVPAARIRVRVDEQGRPADAEAVRIFMN